MKFSIKFQLHEYDDCRFDVHVNDNIYYLRSNDVDEKNKWTTTIEAAKVSSIWIRLRYEILGVKAITQRARKRRDFFQFFLVQIFVFPLE